MEDKVLNTHFRDASIDIVGGGMILYMIFGHIISWTYLNNSGLYIWMDRLFYYFMPWFFFKSGMFYNGQSFKDIWKKRNKLLYPFVFWGFVGVLTYYLINIGHLNLSILIIAPIRTLLFSGTFEGNRALWFLFTLLMVKCFYPLLSSVVRNWQLVLLLFIFTLIVFLLKCHYQLHYPEYLYNMVLGLLFYSLGKEMRDIQYKKQVLIVSIAIFFLVLFLYPSRIDFFHVTIVEGNVVIWVIASIAGIIVVNNLGRCLSVIHFWGGSILEYIGKNSMTFYVSHFIIGNIVFLIMKILNILPENNWVLFAIYSVSLIIILPIICRLFQKEPLRRFVGV